jgi:hypothetical protein
MTPKFRKTHILALGDVCAEAKDVTDKTAIDWTATLLFSAEGHEIEDAVNDTTTGLISPMKVKT